MQTSNLIEGLQMSTPAGDPGVLLVGPGRCKGQSALIEAPSSMAKRIGDIWSPGGGGGLLDQGSPVAGASYHIFAIGTDCGETDYVASRSPSHPLLPSGFAVARRIGSLTTPVAGQILPFQQFGDLFQLITPRVVWGSEALGGPARLLSSGAPAGVKVMIETFVQVWGNGSDGYLCLSDPDLGNAEIFDAALSYNVGLGGRGASVVRLWTDTLGRISAFTNTPATMGNCFLRGWTDHRGGHDAFV